MQIALIAGSNRKDAASTRLLRYIARRLEQGGSAAILLELHVMPLPLFVPDEEADHPNVHHLIETVRAADGLVIATPEYHGSVSGVLKNALDYLDVAHVEGKPVLVASTAGGALGVSSLTHLQAIIRNLHGLNCPEWISLGGDSQRFAPDELPQDLGVLERVDAALASFLALLRNCRSQMAG